MTKLTVKKIVCQECDTTIEVPKWSPNLQTCAVCLGQTKKLPIELDRSADEQETAPVDQVRHAQAVLEALGFTITQRGWHKQYQDNTAVVRIEPYFDIGTPVQPGYALEGFTIVRQEFISIIDKDIASKLPGVAHQDITTLLQQLQMKLPGISLNQTNIDTVECSKCHDITAEWIQLVSSKEILCIQRCAPVRRPHARV